MRVALFGTCLADTFYPATLRATLRVLERAGCRVEFPMAQTCCGQLHYNTGYADSARRRASEFDRIFGDYEAIVAPSGSCAAMVREHYPRMALELPAGAHGRTYELSEFLVDVLGYDATNVAALGSYFPHRVTYHPTCHSLRLLDVGDKPRMLLRGVAGLRLLELADAEVCCGFGGTFAVKNAETSTAMLADKVRCVGGSGAEVLTAGDRSCLMHIGGGLSRLRAGVATVHLAEILASTEEEPWQPTAA